MVQVEINPVNGRVFCGIEILSKRQRNYTSA